MPGGQDLLPLGLEANPGQGVAGRAVDGLPPKLGVKGPEVAGTAQKGPLGAEVVEDGGGLGVGDVVQGAALVGADAA